MRSERGMRLTRRLAIGTVLAALVSAVLTACSKSDGGGVQGPVTLGSVADVQKTLTEQEFMKSDAGHLYLLPAAPDAVIAVSWRCTHQGCMVNAPDTQSGQMKCPCHSSIFDARTGTVVGGPAPRPLDHLPVTIENGMVTVDTRKVMMRRTFEVSQTAPLRS